MATFKKTPGVYIEEKSAFGNSVVPVATAIPVFIGYTEQASFDGKSLKNELVKIGSFVDYLTFFGGAPTPKYNLVVVEGGDDFDLVLNDVKYSLAIADEKDMFYTYNCIRFFYENGGADAYVISIGNYADAKSKKAFTDALEKVAKEDEITMILAPDALKLSKDDYYPLMNTALEQCLKLKSRVTLIDVHDGLTKPENPAWGDEVIGAFRGGVPSNPETASYGISYYPWLHTSIVQDNEVGFDHIDAATDLSTILTPNPQDPTFPASLIEKIKGAADAKTKNTLEMQLKESSRDFKKILREVKKKLNFLPPCSGMAGIYSKVDDQRGVWKAPANIGLNAVIEPHVKIDDKMQEDLNMPLDGKAINAIRVFQGRGAGWVWGARTLDGNSNDWRYVNVRRLFLFLEQSVKSATFPFVFEPNDANTWNTLSSMISNFLNSVWKAGGLVGPTPESAYQVLVGLGVTMTFQDILEGYLKVTVKVAPSRPAEFIVITFMQKMQEA